jgi:hypothetical protein
MKALFTLLLITSLHLTSFGQNGSLAQYWPTNITIGDTLNIDYYTGLPTFDSNGKSCGVLLGYDDTLINTTVELVVNFDMCFTFTPPGGCFRRDTAQYVINHNIDTIKFIWNHRGTICVPFPPRNRDTAYIYFNTTSINENEGKKLFSFHPNPVKDFIQLDFPKGLTIQQIQLWNLNGQQMPSPILEGNKLNFERYKAGVYFLSIESNLGTEVLKLIKE